MILKKKKITSTKDNDFKEFSCQNFVKKNNKSEIKEIDYGVKNLSNKNENTLNEKSETLEDAPHRENTKKIKI